MASELPQFIHFGREICGDLAQAERREWWLANGLGGYAGGTVAGTLTRRYHGLLVAPITASLGRLLVFAKADATLIAGEQRWPLHTNRWTSGAVAPPGYLHLESFHLDGRLPVWRYALDGLRIEARIWMEPAAHTTYLAWRLLPGASAPENLRLWVRLLVNARDHHGQTAVGDFSPPIAASETELSVSIAHAATLRFRTRCGRLYPERTWIEGFHLPGEHERGLPDTDNHLCVGQLSLPLFTDEWVGCVASLEHDPSPYLAEALRRCQQHDAQRLRLAKIQSPPLYDAPDWVEQLVLASNSFLIERPLSATRRGASVIAGYPWFGDWGRDTFIALPGLTLCTHRYELARELLETWGGFLDGGMLPNRFPEDGTAAQYNSADAALWYIEAWRAYVAASQDHVALQRHFPALADIVEHHLRGTRGIRLDAADGLLWAGEEGVQLTWMDAKLGDWVVTPRMGKPVEVNALWYNALMTLADFAEILVHNPEPYRHLAEQTRQGFQRFIQEDGRGLLDVLDGPQGNDATLRPNQILAVSLTHSPLSSTHQAAVIQVVGTSLLTSYGLRTLDPTHADYQGRYTGDVRARDAAYHQGPAWAWLLGHYALAVYRVSGDAAQALSLLEPIGDHLGDAGLGTVSELFDGDPPHTPRGAPSQAWSVACTLQAWCQLQRAKTK
jgi:predicted glycogen debranching enzyme